MIWYDKQLIFHYLYSLSVCDLALIADMMTQKLATYYLGDPAWYIRSFPYFWHPAKGIILGFTIFMVVGVTAERYRAICHPFSKRHVSYQ